MTYLQFHLVFLAVPTVAFTVLAWRRRDRLGHRVPMALFAVSPIAVLYTSPWDQYLIRNAVWWYGEDRVIGAFMGVPYEEYLFMAVQPVLTGAFLLWLLSRRSRALDGPGLGGFWGERIVVGAGLAALGLAIGTPALDTEPGTYLGLLLVWAAPALGALVGASWPGLRRFWKEALTAWAVSTLYLSAADRIAIGLEVWVISPTLSTGIHILGLPLEEFLFFALTNGLVVAGAMLFLIPGMGAGTSPRSETTSSP